MLEVFAVILIQAFIHPIILAATFLVVIIVPRVWYAIPFVIGEMVINYLWETPGTIVPFSESLSSDNMIVGSVVLAAGVALGLIARLLIGGAVGAEKDRRYALAIARAKRRA